MRLSLTFLSMYIFHIRCQFGKPAIQCPVLFRTFQHIMSALAARKRRNTTINACAWRIQKPWPSPRWRGKKVRRRPDEFRNYSNAPQLSLVEITPRLVLNFFYRPPRVALALVELAQLDSCYFARRGKLLPLFSPLFRRLPLLKELFLVKALPSHWNREETKKRETPRCR